MWKKIIKKNGTSMGNNYTTKQTIDQFWNSIILPLMASSN
jgi:hypothetical protein